MLNFISIIVLVTKGEHIILSIRRIGNRFLAISGGRVVASGKTIQEARKNAFDALGLNH